MSGRRGTREGPLTQPGCSRARILAGLHLRAASRVPRQGLLSPDPTLRLPMGAAGQLLDSLWPLPKCPLRPNLVVATWLCKKRLGNGDPRSGVPGRGQVWKQTVPGRVRWARAGNEHLSLESWYTSWLFSVPLPTLLVLTDQELVPCFSEFRFSEIAVNRTLCLKRTDPGLHRGIPPLQFASWKTILTHYSPFSKAKGLHWGLAEALGGSGLRTLQTLYPTQASENAPGAYQPRMGGEG